MTTGDLGKAGGLLEDKRAVLGSNYRWRVSWALLLALEGKPEEALRALDDETLKWADVVHFGTLHVAEVYALSRDTSRAIDWIDRAVRKGDERIDWFRRNPPLASVQQEPGFHRIIAAVDARQQRTVR